MAGSQGEYFLRDSRLFARKIHGLSMPEPTIRGSVQSFAFRFTVTEADIELLTVTGTLSVQVSGQMAGACEERALLM